MLKHKHIEKICAGVVVLCLLITVVFMNYEYFGISQSESTNTYEDKFFSKLAINTIDIIVDADTWHDMLDNASDKEYITCNLMINDEYYSNIAIRAKGNSSLQQVQSNGSDRYSFKIEFDHYDNTTTYYGLDKLCLNNIVQDNTYMKDYVAYTLMNEFGVASPLTNYVSVSVNGETFGLYLGVEAIEDGFLQRNYGYDYGTLYKPETSTNNAGGNTERTQATTNTTDVADIQNMQQGMTGQMGQAAQMSREMPDMTTSEMPDVSAQTDMTGQTGQSSQMSREMPDMTTSEMPDVSAQTDMTGQMGQASQQDRTQTTEQSNTDNESVIAERQTTTQNSGMVNQRSNTGMGSSSSSGLSSAFAYDGDDASSYSYIFDNAVTLFSSTDQEQIIESIKQLNEQEDLQEVIDVEQLIRYFIVHNFLLNFDSYTGSIMHNYYLYEEDGVMTMLPWDYNLSFVAFQTSYSTEELINFPIDTPISGNTVDDRPMLSWIFSNEEYTELYHELFAEFIDEFFVSGYFETMVDDVQTLITDEVESDPSKFCTFEQFTQGVTALKDFVALRVESIIGQLNGTIGSTAETQVNDPNLILAGDVDVTDTGTESVQKGTGNIQSPTRSQGQSSGSKMQSGKNAMMGVQTQISNATQNINISGTISQATQTFGLSEDQLAMIASTAVIVVAFAFVACYKRRKN